MSGTFNGWQPGDSNYLLTEETDGSYTLTLELPAGIPVLYKVTRGTWSSVEVQANGTDIVNRSFTPTDGQQTITLSVLRWKDQ